MRNTLLKQIVSPVFISHSHKPQDGVAFGNELEHVGCGRGL